MPHDRHPDRVLLELLAATGAALEPPLLSECGDDRQRFAEAGGLQCHPGTAPVSYQNRQIRRLHVRRACNKAFRCRVHAFQRPSEAHGD